MQEKAQHATRYLKFKAKLARHARALKANSALNAAWECEMQKRQDLQLQASKKRSNLDDDEQSNDDAGRRQQHETHDDNQQDRASEIGSHVSYKDNFLALSASLGKGGEDAMFEQVLRQRQMWDLRTIRQQRARDRREAEYALRLHKSQARCEEEWRRQEKESEEARAICQANHVQVKKRRLRDEAHIAHVEARFAAIDQRRFAEYNQHLGEIKTARTRRDNIMQHVVDQQTEHERHMELVAENARRLGIERLALIENNLENLEQQRTKHEFLRFIRDVELANRALVERDRMLVVINRAEKRLESRRERIQSGFARTEEAGKRIEQEMAERARALADNREQRHFEARTARIANDEQDALRRLRKAQREQQARERKARDDARRDAEIAARFDQRREEQECRVERLSKKMLARRDDILKSAEKRHHVVEVRQKAAHFIRKNQSSPLVSRN